MARRIITHEFNPARPVYARKKFVSNGHTFRIGDHFDWHRLAVSQRQVAKLFAAGRLRHAQGDDTTEAVSEPVSETPVSEPVFSFADPGTAEDDQGESGTDELDEVDKLADLKEIAEAEGAPTNFVSKKDQREAIRAHRRGE